MAFEWNQTYSVGVDKIDDQHKQLFAMLNKLLDAMRRGEAKHEIIGFFNFMANYADEHFKTEEQYMASFGYANAQVHKAQHTIFKTSVENARRQLESEGYSAALLLEIYKQVGEWLINHICKTDVALGAFLTVKNAA